jgi:hypothetical protein
MVGTDFHSIGKRLGIENQAVFTLKSKIHFYPMGFLQHTDFELDLFKNRLWFSIFFWGRRQGDQIGRIFVYWVTLLSEFSPIGWLFTLGSFFENYRIAQSIGLLIFTVKFVFWFLTKKRVGLHFRAIFCKRVWSPWSSIAIEVFASKMMWRAKKG